MWRWESRWEGDGCVEVGEQVGGGRVCGGGRAGGRVAGVWRWESRWEGDGCVEVGEQVGGGRESRWEGDGCVEVGGGREAGAADMRRSILECLKHETIGRLSGL